MGNLKDPALLGTMLLLGCIDGADEGDWLGCIEGREDGESDGSLLGCIDGKDEGALDGEGLDVSWSARRLAAVKKDLFSSSPETAMAPLSNSTSSMNRIKLFIGIVGIRM